MKDQAEENSRVLAPGLYVVATPIGNLEDLSFRALRVLSQVNWVGAEDTRETRKLLEHYGVQTELHALHEHSTKARIQELAESLKKGGAGAYVSDAGTPGLCDPGPGLVQACVEAGIPVYPVPGAAAPATLLSVAGIAETGFHFHGFFPREKKEREDWASVAAGIGGAQILFESPHRIAGALEFLAAHFAEQNLVVGRELTKRFETITRGTCAAVYGALKNEEPRGEYVLILRLPAASREEAFDSAKVQELIKDLAGLGAGQKILVKAAMSHGMRKNEAYKLALELTEK